MCFILIRFFSNNPNFNFQKDLCSLHIILLVYVLIVICQFATKLNSKDFFENQEIRFSFFSFRTLPFIFVTFALNLFDLQLLICDNHLFRIRGSIEIEIILGGISVSGKRKGTRIGCMQQLHILYLDLNFTFLSTKLS